MRQFNKKYHQIKQQLFTRLPIIYKFLFHTKFSLRKKSIACFGVPVDFYNTPTFFPEGHHKPISKIVDLSVFEKTTS